MTGCGGGSSSAPVTGGNTTVTATPNAKTNTGGSADTHAGSKTNATAQTKQGKSGDAKKSGAKSSKAEGTDRKKHPPLELPEGPPEKAPTKAQQARVPVADLQVSVPGGLTTANTCKGKDESPAITWGSMPPGTTELAIFAVAVEPVGGKLDYAWAMAGLEPSLTGLKAGEVPKGAILGRTATGKNGYSLCPEGSEAETYVFAVYAIQDGLSPKQGFDPSVLREEATPASEHEGITTVTFGG